MRRVGVDGAHDNEYVLILRSDGLWREGQRAGFLEDDGDEIVADVTFARQLLLVVDRVGQHGGHVEHELVAAEFRVHRVRASRVAFNSIYFYIFDRDRERVSEKRLAYLCDRDRRGSWRSS